MFYFIVRIELHNALLADYNTLHAAMVNAGFSRTIKDGSTKIEYHLPTAEYVVYGNYTFDSIITSAKAAILKTGHTGMVLVSQANDVRWNNLSPVR